MRDDGGGAPATTGLGAGRGLIGMRQRLELVGGRLVQAGPHGSGFRVHAWIPLGENAEPRQRREVLS